MATAPNEIPDSVAGVAAGLFSNPKVMWLSGVYERPDALLSALKDRPELEDFHDDLENRQSKVRLEVDPDGHTGLWVITTDDVPESAIEEGAQAYGAKVVEIEAQEAVASEFPNNLDEPTRQLFIQAATAVEEATGLDDIKAAFSQLKNQLQNT